MRMRAVHIRTNDDDSQGDDGEEGGDDAALDCEHLARELHLPVKFDTVIAEKESLYGRT